MMKEWISDQGFLIAPAIALVLFLVLFVAVLFWIYRPGSRTTYDRESQLPFEEGQRKGEDQPRPAPQRRD